jgi:hypothetical protein
MAPAHGVQLGQRVHQDDEGLGEAQEGGHQAGDDQRLDGAAPPLDRGPGDGQNDHDGTEGGVHHVRGPVVSHEHVGEVPERQRLLAAEGPTADVADRP